MYKKVALTSKRNKVYRVTEDDKEHILKIFSDEKSMETELLFLDLLERNGCSVPKTIRAAENFLFLEDLGETTLLDWFEMEERRESDDYYDMISMLSDWLWDFYKITSEKLGINYVLQDVNFRNFILKGDKIYGIDFEQCREGKIEEDLGKLAAFTLMYDPERTPWKIKFVNSLIAIMSNKFSVKPELIIEEMNRELHRMEIRRKQ